MEYLTNSLVGILSTKEIFINVNNKPIYDFLLLRVLNNFKKLKL